VSKGCVVASIVVCFGVVCYIVCVGVAIVADGRLYVYSYYDRVVVGCLPGLCTAGVMSYVTRIDPTWVAVVGTGVIRFLVSLQKTRVTYPELHWQVTIDRSRSLPGCYFSTKQPVYPHCLLHVCSSYLLGSTPGFYLL
jgi:hypothetical protein